MNVDREVKEDKNWVWVRLEETLAELVLNWDCGKGTERFRLFQSIKSFVQSFVKLISTYKTGWGKLGEKEIFHISIQMNLKYTQRTLGFSKQSWSQDAGQNLVLVKLRSGKDNVSIFIIYNCFPSPVFTRSFV